MYLGLDLGTTNVKAAVVDEHGRPVAAVAVPLERFCTPDGGIEQDIEQIWEATQAAMRQATNDLAATSIRAIGVSSQGGAMQLLDPHERPQGRVISWLDQRGHSYDAALTAELGKEFFAQHLGHAASDVALGQILRLRQQAPARIRPPNGVGFVGDVIVGRLCGRRAHDATSLGIAMLYNPRLGSPDPEIMARLGLLDEQLPCLLPATVAAGTLRPPVANAVGLPPGIPVSPAVHDQYAASLGAACVGEGDVNFGAGTAWVLLANTSRLAPPVTGEAYVCRHPVDGLYGQMLSMRNGGSAIHWMSSLLGDRLADPEHVDQTLDAVPPGCEGLHFWPFLSGGPPTNRFSYGGGCLAGITLAHSRNHFVRAVIEGLACELLRHIRLFTEAGMPVNHLVMCGSVTAGRNVPQIIADVTNLAVECIDAADVSALGAAMIARRLVDADADLAGIARQWAPARRRVCPGHHAPAYRDLLAEYFRFLDNSPSDTAR